MCSCHIKNLLRGRLKVDALASHPQAASEYARGGYRLLRSALSRVDRILGTEWHIRIQNRLLGFHYNQYKFSSDAIAFVHIPKSGGTTLHHLLKQISSVAFVNLGMHRPVSIRCPPGKHRYITFMRNPVDRVWSYYRMVLRGEGSLYEIFADHGIEHFLRHCREARNAACRYIGGEPYREPDRTCLERAWSNLQHFYFVGRFEHLDTDTRHLFDLLGKEDRKFPVPHLRRGENSLRTAREEEIIVQYNRLDIELYARFRECW